MSRGSIAERQSRAPGGFRLLRLRRAAGGSWKLALLLLPLAAALLASPASANFPDACPVSFSMMRSDAEENRFVQLLNYYRVQNGVPPVARSPALGRAAV